MFKNRLNRSLAAVCLCLCAVSGLDAQTNEVTSNETSISSTNNPAQEISTTEVSLASTNPPVEPAPRAAVSPTNAPVRELSGRPDYWPLVISAEGGTTGVGGVAGLRWADHFGLRGGGDYLDVSLTHTFEDVQYQGRVRLQSESAALDFYPSKKHSFRISVGAFFNQNQFTGNPDPNQSITIGGVTYTPAEFGNVRLKVKQQPVSPYVSIGGNFFYFDRGHHWSLGGELGVAYGRWDVSLTQSGGLNPPGLDQALASQKKLIQDNLNNWPVWPIAKLQLSFTF